MINYYVIQTKKQIISKKPRRYSSLEELEDGGLTQGGCCGFGGRIANSRLIMVIGSDSPTSVDMPANLLNDDEVDSDLILIVSQYEIEQQQSSTSQRGCLSQLFSRVCRQKSQPRVFDNSQLATIVAFSESNDEGNDAAWNNRLKAMKQYCAKLNSTSMNSAVDASTPLLS